MGRKTSLNLSSIRLCICPKEELKVDETKIYSFSKFTFYQHAANRDYKGLQTVTEIFAQIKYSVKIFNLTTFLNLLYIYIFK